MKRALLGLLVLPAAACTTNNDDPTIRMHIIENGIVGNEPPSQSLFVELNRPYGHTWAPVSATFNGANAELMTEGGREGTLRDPEVPASAYFKVPMTSIERGVHLEIIEGDEHFTVEAPDFNAPRSVNIHTPVDALHADEWLEVDSGVPTDTLDGGFHVQFDTVVGPSICFTQWATERSATSISFKMPPAHEFTSCGAAPTPEPGSTRTVDLVIGLDRSLSPVTRCDGPNLTCDPLTAPAAETTVNATLQF
jgi:hypothetical protein